ncbi:hypothetical protein MRB53_027121 [Persea americana]|uniref:Uncharacterized protein n=1 Tax=Persea americana TaxID=3435 RepID=A0ACC2LKH7_PERAE|nr:hypothetical protein MRB53_027121 [Persea americana]
MRSMRTQESVQISSLLFAISFKNQTVVLSHATIYIGSIQIQCPSLLSCGMRKVHVNVNTVPLRVSFVSAMKLLRQATAMGPSKQEHRLEKFMKATGYAN